MVTIATVSADERLYYPVRTLPYTPAIRDWLARAPVVPHALDPTGSLWTYQVLGSGSS